MDVSLKKILSAALSAWCLLLPNFSYATTHTFPGVVPSGSSYQIPAGDVLNVISGTMQLNSTNIVDSYTVQLLNNASVNVSSGATIGYNGVDSLGAAINSNRSDNALTTEIITNDGSIIGGTQSIYAISLSNSIGAGVQDSGFIVNRGSIVGDINTQGLNTVTLRLNGLSSSINGSIRLNAVTSSTIDVGNPLTTGGPANFSSNGTLDSINLLEVFDGSTFTLYDTASIGALTIDANVAAGGGTFVANNVISGLPTDGDINNNGQLTISANINKTGAFNTSATGTTTFKEAVSVTTTGIDGYNNLGTHEVVGTDKLNVGTVVFTAATPNFNFFRMTYGGGYLPAGTFVLVSAPAIGTFIPANASAPAPTAFINFGVPAVLGNEIVTTLTRTGYYNYATSYLTKALGVALENIGAGTTNSEMISLLSAIEGTGSNGSGAAVEGALRQLLPLMSAPLHGFEVQNQSMDQAVLRLASLRTQMYVAGDLTRDNSFWIRPFGNTANQRKKDAILGYYATTGGLAFGIDRYLDSKYIMGAAASYGLSHVIDKINTASQTIIKNYQIMLYGSYNFTKTQYLDWVMGVAANNYDGLRNIGINNLDLTAKSTYSSQQVSVKGLWGKEYAFSDFFQLTPQASLQYTFAKQYDYAETEGQGANLNVSYDNSNIVQVGAGGKIGVPLDLNPGICFPEIHAFVLYNVINSRQTTLFSFAEGGQSINSTMLQARAGLKLGASLTFALMNRLELKLNYDHEVRDRYTNNAYYLNFKFTF
jgi:outer membrane autotransporter protein